MKSFIRKVRSYLTYKIIRPKYTLNKDVKTIRLGTAYGGWVIPENFINAESIVYSPGAGDDISFDTELVEKYNCTVHIFDPTPKSIKYVTELKKTIDPAISEKLIFHDIGLFDRDTVLKFYAPANEEHVSHSISNLQHTDTFFEAKVRSLENVMKEQGHKHIDLLKMNIEGAEYAVIDEFLSKKISIPTLCVNFHNPAIKMVRTMKKLEKAGYSVIDASDYWNYTFYKHQ